MRGAACKNAKSAWVQFLITSPDPYFSSFPEHNSAFVRNIIMLHGKVIEQVST